MDADLVEEAFHGRFDNLEDGRRKNGGIETAVEHCLEGSDVVNLRAGGVLEESDVVLGASQDVFDKLDLILPVYVVKCGNRRAGESEIGKGIGREQVAQNRVNVDVCGRVSGDSERLRGVEHVGFGDEQKKVADGVNVETFDDFVGGGTRVVHEVHQVAETRHQLDELLEVGSEVFAFEIEIIRSQAEHVIFDFHVGVEDERLHDVGECGVVNDRFFANVEKVDELVADRLVGEVEVFGENVESVREVDGGVGIVKDVDDVEENGDFAFEIVGGEVAEDGVEIDCFEVRGDGFDAGENGVHDFGYVDAVHQFEIQKAFHRFVSVDEEFDLVPGLLILERVDDIGGEGGSVYVG